MSTVTAHVNGCICFLGALSILACQPVRRTFSAGGSGGASPGAGGSSSGPDGGGSGGAEADGGDSGAPDGPVTCAGTLTDCGGQCVDIGTSPTNCGACQHDCGGGTCTLGQCGPMTVYTATLPIGTIAVSTTEVYLSTDDDATSTYDLLACPDTGCVLAPRQVTSMEYPINAIAWVPDPVTPMVVYQSAAAQASERPALFPCPTSGCVGAPSSVIEDGLGSFAASLPVFGNHVYYDTQDFGLNSVTCAAGVCTDGTALDVKNGAACSLSVA